MWVLAMDLSTSVGSLALLQNRDPCNEIVWEQTRATNQRLFQAVPELLRNTGVSLSDIGLFAVGLGPGAFSGIRISLTAALAMAMPEDKPVLGVSSSMALAHSAMEKYRIESATVLGDARRDQIWVASYRAAPGWLDATDRFDLSTWADLPTHISLDSTIVTSDWARIGERIRLTLPPATAVIQERVLPGARVVGRIVYERSLASPSILQNNNRQALSPIYLHPPVSAPPVKK